MKAFLVLVLLAPLVLTGHAKDLNITNFRASDNSFKLLGPGDLTFQQIAYPDNRVQAVAVYGQEKAHWYKFLILRINAAQKFNTLEDRVAYVYQTLMLDIKDYKPVGVFEVTQDDKLIGFRITTKHFIRKSGKTDYYQHVNVYENNNLYYAVIARSRVLDTPNWLQLAFCSSVECTKQDYKILHIPKELSQ